MNIRHRRRVPVVTQMQQTECGLCCVAMILRYYRSYETLGDLRAHLEAGRDGIRIRQLHQLLGQLGFESRLYKADCEGLRYVRLPAILFWNRDHFVVLESVRKNRASIIDPNFGRRTIAWEELQQSFGGFVLTAEPTERFVPKRERPRVWTPYLREVFRHRPLFAGVFALSLATYLLTLSIPMLVQYLIDGIIMQARPELLRAGVAAALAIALLYGALQFLRGKCLIRLQIALDREVTGRVFRHLLEVPYKFFEVRSFGDIMFRLGSLRVVRDLISEQLIRGVIDFGALLFITGYMLAKSPLLTVAALALFALNGFLIIYSRPFIVEANQNEIVELTKLQTIQVETMYAIMSVKTSGMEDVVYRNWRQKFQDVLDKFHIRAGLQNRFDSMTAAVQTVSPFVVLLAAAALYFRGDLTLGEAVAFHALTSMFFSMSVSLFHMYNNFLLASAYLERVKDITDTEPEKKPEHPIPLKLTGDIRLENVSFSYTRHAAPVVRNVSLHIRAGQHVAFVGPSGSGKSTLGKIIAALYEPTAGRIYYDGIDTEQLDRTDLRRQMGVVPQDIALFNKSILENIRMNEAHIDLETVRQAARVAQIADDVESMPMGYHTLVSEMGMNLSGGQRQRIALARALVRSPSVLVLDEATSSLDAVNEAKIAEHFRQMGCTRIVIAHRLSTVKNADVIYVMDNGEIVESGTHDELMRLDGLYARLYRSQDVEAKAAAEAAVTADAATPAAGLAAAPVAVERGNGR